MDVSRDYIDGDYEWVKEKKKQSASYHRINIHRLIQFVAAMYRYQWPMGEDETEKEGTR